jgi:hypothetical protein
VQRSGRWRKRLLLRGGHAEGQQCGERKSFKDDIHATTAPPKTRIIAL